MGFSPFGCKSTYFRITWHVNVGEYYILGSRRQSTNEKGNITCVAVTNSRIVIQCVDRKWHFIYLCLLSVQILIGFALSLISTNLRLFSLIISPANDDEHYYCRRRRCRRLCWAWRNVVENSSNARKFIWHAFIRWWMWRRDTIPCNRSSLTFSRTITRNT